MKQTITYLSIILLAFFLVFCDNKNKEKKAESNTQVQEGEAKFAFNKLIHNFGNLNAGEIVVFTFEFENSGDADLVIKKAVNGCVCTTVNFDKKKIKPGEKGLIEIEYDSTGQWGKQFNPIEIIANTKQKSIQLAVVANVKNDQIDIKN